MILDFYLRWKFKKIKRKFAFLTNKNAFNVNEIDSEIAELADRIYDEKKFLKSGNYIYEFGFCATELYDVGGHTSCLKSLAESLYSEAHEKKLPLFLSAIETTHKCSGNLIKKLKDCVNIFGIEFSRKNLRNDITFLYNNIIKNLPNTLFIYIHSDDIAFAMVLSLLKKYEPVKLIFFNHASHLPNVGMNFSHLIWECLPASLKITENQRHIRSKSIVIGLQSKKVKDVIIYPENTIYDIRSKFGVIGDGFLTMSGGASYKFFNNIGSEYFEMIKKILIMEPKLCHVVISNFSVEEKKIIDSIFLDRMDLMERLKFSSLTPNFDPLFQAADVFIDSFPQSSALTQIDLMRNRVASVVKINKDNPEKSFHEYLPENYPYIFEEVEDMIEGILKLLYDIDERKRIIEMNYKFWLTTYESDVVKGRALKIVEKMYEC